MCHADPTGVTILNHLVIFAVFPVFQAVSLVTSDTWDCDTHPLSVSHASPGLTYHRWEYLAAIEPDVNSFISHDS